MLRTYPEAHFRKILESFPDAVMLIGNDGTISMANSRAARLFGTTRERLEGRYALDFLPPKMRIERKSRFRRFLRTGRDLSARREIEIIIRTRAGEVLPIGVTAAPIKADGGFGALVVCRDIIERKNVENALRESRARYETLVWTSPDAITVTDLQGRITEVSDQTLRIHGYASASELLGKNSFMLIAPQDRARAFENAGKVAASGNISGLRYRLLRKDGGTFVGEMDVSRLDKPDGTPYGFIATVRDVTSREINEKRLMTQYLISGILAESGSLDEAAPKAILTICANLGWDWGEFWSYDKGKNVLFCTQLWHDPAVHFPEFESATMRTVFGPDSGLPGKAWAARAPVWVEDVTKDPDFLRSRAAQKEKLRGAIAFPIVAGEDFIGVMSFFARERRGRDEERIRTFATLGRQIGHFAEHMRAEESLRESEEKYRTIVEKSHDMVMITDSDGVITYLSPASREVTGYEPAALMGRQYARLAHPEDRRFADRIFQRSLNGEGGAHVEYRIIGVNGAVRWVSHSWQPIMSDGSMRMNVSLLHEITERKKGEEFRKEYYKMVEREIEEKTRELRKQKEELERKNRLLEQFKSFALKREYELTELRREVRRLRI